MRARPRRVRINLRENIMTVESFDSHTQGWVENLVVSFRPEVVRAVEKPYNVPGLKVWLLDDTQEGWHTIVRAAIMQ